MNAAEQILAPVTNQVNPTWRDVKRFWAHVAKAPDNECWCWQSAVNGDSYGLISINGRAVLTHRLAWIIANGEIPYGLQVLHHCDNPPCCNPSHLWTGTHEDNHRDKIEKGRHAHGANHALNVSHGENHYMAVLTVEKVTDIKARWRKGERAADIAKAHAVSLSCVKGVVYRQSWKHVA